MICCFGFTYKPFVLGRFKIVSIRKRLEILDFKLIKRFLKLFRLQLPDNVIPDPRIIKSFIWMRLIKLVYGESIRRAHCTLLVPISVVLVFRNAFEYCAAIWTAMSFKLCGGCRSNQVSKYFVGVRHNISLR